MVQLSGTAPPVSITDPGNLGFPATVVQSIGACTSKLPFPIVNNGTCPTTINSLVLSETNVPPDYSLLAAPAAPVTLDPGHVYGDGNLNVLFGPNGLSRALQGMLTYTYVDNPYTGHVSAPVVRNLCGEGVDTGARVLVTKGGVPVPTVAEIELEFVPGGTSPASAVAGNVSAAAKKLKKKVLDVGLQLPLQTVTQAAPCASFQFHREYGGVSNPIQLAPGNYQVIVTIAKGSSHVSKTVTFSVTTCGFDQNIVVAF